MWKLIAFCGLCLLPVETAAATMRLDVRGSLASAVIGNLVIQDGARSETTLGYLSVTDPSSPYYMPDVVEGSGVGSLTFDSERPRNGVSSCTGILTVFCRWVSSPVNIATGEVWSGSSAGYAALRQTADPSLAGHLTMRREYRLPTDMQGERAFSGAVYGFTPIDTQPAYVRDWVTGGYVSTFGLPTVLGVNYDLTEVSVTAVPLPAGLLMLLSGLSGLAWIGRRRATP